MVQSLAAVARGFCTIVPVLAQHLLALTNAVVDVLKLCSGDSAPLVKVFSSGETHRLQALQAPGLAPSC